MDEQRDTLIARIEQLEGMVATLQRDVRALHGIPVPEFVQPVAQPVPAPVQGAPLPRVAAAPVVAAPQSQQARPRITRPRFDLVRDGEFWLNKIGIGLLLFGVAFLFKYSIDQGWLTPVVRIMFGVVLGAGLLGAGTLLRERRPNLGHVLLGGGIATLYLASFAAYGLYNLLPYSAAFGSMCAVTLLAYGMSVWHKRPMLSIIATVGGLGTPFVLYTDAQGVIGLITYTSIVLAGVSAIYGYFGWRSLLWTAFGGVWIILLLGTTSFMFGSSVPLADRWAMQVGIAWAALAFWALPVWRDRQHTAVAAADSAASVRSLVAALAVASTPLLTLSTPVFALGTSFLIWSLDHTAWGWIVLAVASVFALVAWRVRSALLRSTHVIVALLLTTASLVLLLNGDLLIVMLAAQATTVLWVARRVGDRVTPWIAHGLFSTVALWLAARVLDGTVVARPIANGQALSDLVVIGLIVLASLMQPIRLAAVYRGYAWGMLLGWLQRELDRLPNGGGYVTIAWGVLAVGLLVAGLRFDRAFAVKVGIGTLLLVVIKLFLVDLDALEAIWRVILFMGFGGLFLLLSYFFPTLWRPARSAEQADQPLPHAGDHA